MRRVLLLAVMMVTGACGDPLPAFISVWEPTSTTDSVGPYRVEARVVAPHGVLRLFVKLRQRPDSQVFTELNMLPIVERHDGGEYYIELPGRPAGTQFDYYLQLIDGKTEGGGAIVRYPETAPTDLLHFEILPP